MLYDHKLITAWVFANLNFMPRDIRTKFENALALQEKGNTSIVQNVLGDTFPQILAWFDTSTIIPNGDAGREGF